MESGLPTSGTGRGVNMPNMICLAGMPGVGKTTWANKFLENHPDYHYFSPDLYYERINGDDCIRANTFEVWMAMFRDINTAMKAGKNVAETEVLLLPVLKKAKEKYADLADILFVLRTNITTLTEAIKPQCYDAYKKWSLVYQRVEQGEE